MAADSALEIPEALNLADAFLEARLREGRGDAIAIRTADGTTSYAEVSRMAHRFANVLRDLGVDPEQRVIIGLPDVPAFAWSLFGTLLSGSVVVMVNSQLKADEIAYFYEYTRAKVAVVHAGDLGVFVQAAGNARDLRHILVMGVPNAASGTLSGELTDWNRAEPGAVLGRAGRAEIRSLDALVGAAADRAEVYPTHRDDPAIWLFSGGTTGRPKAVIQTHGSFYYTTLCYGQGVLGMQPGDITLSVPKLYFGYAMGSNLLFPFSVGASTILFPERCTAEVLFGHIARHRPTVLINVPTMINHMVGHPGARAQDLSCLRLCTSAGEALPVELYERWQALFGVELLDGLGTAEMWHIFVSNRPGDVKPGTLGKVVPGFEVKVCDDDGRELGPDEVGWLWVKGDARAIGYWHAMPKTMQAFRGEWYVSGDMIAKDAGGYITYCGRGDDMLKVAGKWLAPGEVENCLLTHPAVKECAVVGVTDASGLTKPHAYVVAAEQRAGLDEELKAFVRDRLAPYKAPRAVFFLDAMPRTHLGKIDRGKLRAPMTAMSRPDGK
jgi:benzoate-CoA ligase family protein